MMGRGPRVVSLRSQLAVGVLAFGSERPRLTWRVESGRAGGRQLGYEVQAATSPGFEEPLASTGDVSGSAQIGIPAPGPALQSREVRHYRVRVRTEEGDSDWSAPLRIEAGLFRASDWRASAITLAADPGRGRSAPAPCLRREFPLASEPRRARLYVTSFGVHEIRINGSRIGRQLLSPGWTSYQNRLLADTHDVTALLRPGINAIGAVLGDGWYRGRLGWEPDHDRCRYGQDVGLVLQLETELVDGQTAIVVSDETWRASCGEVRAADLYDGATVDLRERQAGWDQAGFDDTTWSPPISIPFDPRMIEARMTPPVCEIQTRRVEPVRRPDGRLRLDSGQNLAGFVRLRVRGRPGDRVTVRHAEVVEPDGTLHTLALRSARATDDYVLGAEGEEVLQPPFTFHGFRYADVETPAEVLSAEVVAMSSDLPRRGRFACSDERLNRLHENALWSQRSNFVSIPTDCPQRDERLGWTGDVQAFAPTACTLFDSEAFLQSWLRDLDLDQDDDLGVSSVVPDVVLSGDARFGRAGWADAATIVPWALYESNGDPAVLRRQFASMKRWVDSLVRRQRRDGLLEPSWQFGDWLDPDAPSHRPWEAKTNAEFIANGFFAHSAGLLADAAVVVGDPTAAARYRSLAERVSRATWSRWSSDALRTQTGCAIALQFRIAPADARNSVEAALASLVSDSDGRVATGFLGTPLILPALADAGLFDEAYRMLLRTERPSWLYQVEHGATTVWERWDAIQSDGSIHPGTMAPISGNGAEGHMLSFNHYAYGAVIDWVYRHLAGVAPDRSRPGYTRAVLAPKPVRGITWARGSVESAYGTVSIDWRLENGRFEADIELPFGTKGTFVPPATARSQVAVDGTRPTAGRSIELAPGRHHLIVSEPSICLSDAEGVAAAVV